MISSRETLSKPRGRRNPAIRFGSIAARLFLAAASLFGQDGPWTYRPTTDPLSDVRSDSAWTDAVLPVTPGYRLGVTCEDTEYISVFVRSDAEMSSQEKLNVRFDEGSSEALPVERSLATTKGFYLEPAAPAVRRMLASRKMVLSVRNASSQDVAVEFDVAGLGRVIKQMPLKCQDRFAELAAERKPAPKSR